MIAPAYVRTMAAYNAEMNRRLYGSAARLPDLVRREPRGAFWGSLHGTLNHLLWADRMWMSRFDGWERPPVGLSGSAGMIGDFDALHAERTAADARLSDWAGRIDADWLAQDLVWFSGAQQKEMRRPRDILVVHLFNHQAHHRGQAHALLTAAGEATGDTDLPFILAPASFG